MSTYRIEYHTNSPSYSRPIHGLEDFLETDQTGTNVLYVIDYTAISPEIVLPGHIVSKAQTKQAVIVIDYTLESLMTEAEVYGKHDRHRDLIKLKQFSFKYQIPKSQLIVCTGNLKLSTQREFEVLAHCTWQSSGQILSNKNKYQIISNIAKKVDRPYKYMSLMRRPTDARVVFAYEMSKRPLHQNKVTCWWSSDPTSSFNFTPYSVSQRAHKLGREFDDKSIKSFCDSLPWMWDYDPGTEEENNPNCTSTGNQEWLFQNSYVNVAHETFFFNQHEQLFLSEKSFKSFIMMQPFVIFGHPGTLNWLHTEGYYTFSDWWDESYDLTLDDSRRFDKIMNIVDWIAGQSNDYLNDMLVDMLVVLQENQHRAQENKLNNQYTFWGILKPRLAELL